MKHALSISIYLALVLVFAGCEISSNDSSDSSSNSDSTIAVTGITISGSSSVTVGKTITLTDSVTPSNATDKTVTWSTSNSTYAIVNSTSGVVTGVKAGTAVITAKAGSKTKTKSITVNAARSSGGDTSESTNLVTSVTATKTYFAPGWTEETATLTGSLSNGYNYVLPSATTAQWQAQLKLTTDADLSSGDTYSFSVKLKSTVDMSNVTVKFDDTTEIVYDATVALTANTTKTYTATGTASASATNIVFVFDFGNNSAGTVTVSDLTLTKTSESQSGSSDDTVDTTTANVGSSTTSFTASSPTDSSTFDTIVWSDEFNGTSLDTTNTWTCETGAGGWGNSEQQTYTSSSNNISVADGCLKITAKSDLSSARIKTQDKKYFTYGKIVARLKCDQGAGSWPAFWMLGQNMSNSVTWPYCGEIDIMEHANSDAFAYETCHWNGNGSSTSTTYSHASYGGKTNDNNCTNMSSLDITQWHEYSIVWTSTAINFYVDTTKVMAIAIGDSSSGLDAFNKPFFILFNFAMGGQFTGIYNSSSFTNMPWNMYVDYVRVYQ